MKFQQIKNNAWAEGAIDDDAFVQGINFDQRRNFTNLKLKNLIIQISFK